MISAFFVSANTLSTESQDLTLISDNIANVNTIGYKEKTPVFSSILNEVVTSNTGSTEVGSYVDVSQTLHNFSQGILMQTDQPLNVAITGPGFFIVSDGDNYYYTRNGEFKLTKEGDNVYITTPDGLKILGTTDINASLTELTNLSPIEISYSLPPKATTYVNFYQTNLEAAAPIKSEPFDPNNPDSYNYSGSFKIYDAKGNVYNAEVYFKKVENGKWQVYFGSGDTIFNRDNPITLEFNSTGKLVTVNGASTTQVTLNFEGILDNPITIDFKEVTNWSYNFTMQIETDGYPLGELTSLGISKEGIVTVNYSNGISKNIARLALAYFADEQALTDIGGARFVDILNNASPKYFPAGYVSSLLPNALEASNVDLGKQIINLIKAQRIYQANAKALTTSDEMVVDALGLKR
jgi:flagellar hook protein FlgE